MKTGDKYWDGVQSYLDEHGHLPSDTAAPCRHCFVAWERAVYNLREIHTLVAKMREGLERIAGVHGAASTVLLADAKEIARKALAENADCDCAACGEARGSEQEEGEP